MRVFRLFRRLDPLKQILSLWDMQVTKHSLSPSSRRTILIVPISFELSYNSEIFYILRAVVELFREEQIRIQGPLKAIRVSHTHAGASASNSAWWE